MSIALPHKWWIVAILTFVVATTARADVMWLNFDDGSGLSGIASLEQIGDREIRVTLENTSTSMPLSIAGDESNQLLTSVSFDFGAGIEIVSGSAVLGQGARTVNFDGIDSQLTSPGDDVTGEWGYSNDGDKINLARNVITAMKSQSTAFGGLNLDGPSNLNGPQGGLLADPALIPLDGLGGIAGPVVFTVQLSNDWNMSNFDASTARIEFGSDAAYVGTPSVGAPVPEPATLALLGVGGLAFAGAWRRRQRRMKHA